MEEAPVEVAAAPARAPLCVTCLTAGAGAYLGCHRCPAFVHATPACFGRKRMPVLPQPWLCNACEGRVDVARARAVRSAVAGGALGVPLTDPAAAKELTHAVAVILASNPDPSRVQRVVASAKIRARFAAALQEADEACLAAGRPFSLRAMLRMASQEKRGAIFARNA